MEVTRSHDLTVLQSANRADYTMHPSDEVWLGIPENVMYQKDDDVGLATYDYPGLFAVHWFFRSKGKDALRTAVEMLDDLFTNYGALAVRGVIHMDNKPSRFLAKRLGFERISIEEFLDGPNELILLTKETFNRVKETM
jgi:hypothetical protein